MMHVDVGSLHFIENYVIYINVGLSASIVGPMKNVRKKYAIKSNVPWLVLTYFQELPIKINVMYSLWISPLLWFIYSFLFTIHSFSNACSEWNRNEKEKLWRKSEMKWKKLTNTHWTIVDFQFFSSLPWTLFTFQRFIAHMLDTQLLLLRVFYFSVFRSLSCVLLLCSETIMMKNEEK